MCATIGTDSSEDDGKEEDPGLAWATALRDIVPIRTDMDDISSGEEALVLSPSPLGLKDNTTMHNIVPTPLGLTLQELVKDSSGPLQMISVAALVSPKTAIKAVATGIVDSALVSPKTAIKAAVTGTIDLAATTEKAASAAATSARQGNSGAATGTIDSASVTGKADSAAATRRVNSVVATWTVDLAVATLGDTKANKTKSKKASKAKKQKTTPKKTADTHENNKGANQAGATNTDTTVQETKNSMQGK
jgi:hypothetical protein